MTRSRLSPASCISFALTLILASSSSAAEIPVTSTLQKIKIGGEIRGRYESSDNYDLNNTRGDENSHAFLRTRLNFALQATDDLNAYIQFQDARRYGDEASTLSDDEGLDLRQAWVEWKNPFGWPITTKAGRQTLSYGAERLIGATDWSNIGRSFDAGKLTTRLGPWDLDLFGSIIADENRSDNDHTLWGLVGTWKQSNVTFQPYLFFERDGRDSYVSESAVAGKLKEWTPGLYLFWKYNDRLTFDVEGSTQFGRRSGDKIEAWALHGGLAYVIDPSNKLTFVGEYNVASGDKNPTDRTLETFDRHGNYGTNHNKYGYADLFAWKNMENVRLGLKFNPWPSTLFSFDYHHFRLNRTTDAWYQASGAVLNAYGARTFPSKSLGSEYDLYFEHKANDYLDFLGGYSVFVMSQPVPATGQEDSAKFFYLQSRFRF